MKVLLGTLFLSSLFIYAGGFYIPGVAPQFFQKGDPVDLKAVKLTSEKALLPYEYYYYPFCKPASGVVYRTENFGEVLRGDRIVNTGYNVKMATNCMCSVLCQKDLTSEETNKFIDAIQDDYHVHMLIDNLPIATRMVVGAEENVVLGYQLGFSSNGKTMIMNHLAFRISYHQEIDGTYRVVAFDVSPSSIQSDKIQTTSTDECTLPKSSETLQAQYLARDKETKIAFTYSVEWIERQDISWASRWDRYLEMKNAEVHWFSIGNSIFIIMILASLVSLILFRTLKKDIQKYNNPSDDVEDVLEETGWKLVWGDVFRPPQYPLLFSALIGSGVQIYGMAILIIVFATLGMMSPSSRGSLMTGMIVLFELFGVLAGFFSGRIYRTLKGSNWRQAALTTGLLFPGIVFSIGFFLNCFIWGVKSSGAVPVGTMFSLLALWLLVSLPLTFAGYFIGFGKVGAFKNPLRTNQIPRQLPVGHINWLWSALACGLLPFGSVFIEVFYIFSAIWRGQTYYLFGFLLIVFFILIVCVSLISVVATYLQLCHEHYGWWWRSFTNGTGTAIYVMAYAFFYFFHYLEITDFVPTLMYIGYTVIFCLSLGLLTGCIGFVASYFFVRYIFSSIKVD